MSIQSVERALDILSLFSAARPRLGITDISRELDLRKPTVHGIVQSLMNRGFLIQDPETRKYGLGFAIYELGAILAGTLRINQVGTGPARELSRTTGMMTRIAIWDQESALISLNIFPNAEASGFQPLGPRIPAYCSAVGKAILAWLPEPERMSYLERITLSRFTVHTLVGKEELIKDLAAAPERGYALDREEFMAGLCCMAAPLFGPDGTVIASLSLSGGLNLFEQDFQDKVRRLIQTAAEISRYMGHAPEGAHTPRSPQ